MSSPKSNLLSAYLLLAKQLNPVWRWVLNRRIAAGKETCISAAQKLMTQPITRSARPIVWGHAVGVGESFALTGLFARLSLVLPDHQFLITSTARSASQALANHKLNALTNQPWVHQCAPIDTPQVVDAFLDYWQPVMAIWCELDLWPALISGTAARNIPMALVNARLSRQSFVQRRRLSSLYRPLLQSFHAMYTQNQFSCESLASLAALDTLDVDSHTAARCSVSGSIKILGQALGVDPAQLALWQTSLINRPVWLFASSHETEEPLAFAAHRQLLLTHPNALLIIAPRYPKRGDSITSASHIQSFKTEQRSRKNSEVSPVIKSPCDLTTQVYVADTIGEMGLWYRVSQAVMMGGSYCAVEGHNPFEAIVLGRRIIYGPRTANFSESYEDLSAQGLAHRQTGSQQIAQTVQTIWQTRASISSTHSETPITPAMQSMLDALTGMINQNTPAMHPSSSMNR